VLYFVCVLHSDVSTLTGSTTSGFADGMGTGAMFSFPYQSAVDIAGNVFVSDKNNQRIRRITPFGLVTTVAGSGTAGYVDGYGTLTSFRLEYSGIVVDAAGTLLLVADPGNFCVRRIDIGTGLVTTFVGSGQSGLADGVGTAAKFQYPGLLALDASGNVYVAERGPRMRKITPAGVVTSVAGSATGWKDGVGTNAQFSTPIGIAVDRNGTLWVADTYNNYRIRRITQDGMVTTVAGDGTDRFADGLGTLARINSAYGLTFGADRNADILLIGENSNRIRQLVWNGSVAIVTTFAGSGANAYMDGTGTAVGFQLPFGVTADRTGTNVIVLSYNGEPVTGPMTTSMVRKVSPAASCSSGSYSVNASSCVACATLGIFCPSGTVLLSLVGCLNIVSLPRYIYLDIDIRLANVAHGLPGGIRLQCGRFGRAKCVFAWHILSHLGPVSQCCMFGWIVLSFICTIDPHPVPRWYLWQRHGPNFVSNMPGRIRLPRRWHDGTRDVSAGGVVPSERLVGLRVCAMYSGVVLSDCDGDRRGLGVCGWQCGLHGVCGDGSGCAVPCWYDSYLSSVL
jgi:hypothetical protein